MVDYAEPATKLEHKGYNRGLILGLTMAESMLLLVFCLLLVAAAIINAERAKTRLAQDDLLKSKVEVASLKTKDKQAEKAAKELRDKLAALENQLRSVSLIPADRAKFEKEWRDLVDANTELQLLKKEGVTAEKMAALQKAADELEKTMAVLKDSGLSTTDAKVLAERLKALLENEQKQAQSKPHEWPPIINLSEAEGYYFQSGSAELAGPFDEKLRGPISNKIATSLQTYDVDVIEVIGHTDEQPISRGTSNLDQSFIDVLAGKKPISSVLPADNAGLGLARAIAVANVLKADGKLKNATILPMSAAQLVLPGDILTTGQAGDVKSRRRIEIRIRSRNATVTP
ncbi:flagellar motor protein MotB [Ensifer adhaerens]|uniref:Flagellar motor protein MotB n=1 Tax=Ensifer adhaerens TaxID=106592 RepID=A0ACC5SZD4_ENSAD|nr:OmpA family protein [Ensifer adhaerens]MBP1874039.1 flagellar motor protein MotB [Ensifer adhaerens]